MKNKGNFKIFIIILNIVGVICLIYYSIPFLKHDMTILAPNSMLPSYSWDSCGFILMLGLIPLIVANTLAFMYLKLRNKLLKLLFFIPSFICLIFVIWYLVISFNNDEDIYEPELITSFKCELNGKVYDYTIYKEQDETYSVGMDEKDKMPINIIDYDTVDDISNSIFNYYKDNGGMCP